MLNDQLKMLTENLPQVGEAQFIMIVERAADLVQTFSKELLDSEGVDEESEELVFSTLDAVTKVLNEASTRLMRKHQ